MAAAYTKDRRLWLSLNATFVMHGQTPDSHAELVEASGRESDNCHKTKLTIRRNIPSLLDILLPFAAMPAIINTPMGVWAFGSDSVRIAELPDLVNLIKLYCRFAMIDCNLIQHVRVARGNE